jgi:hypothetical protein
MRAGPNGESGPVAGAEPVSEMLELLKRVTDGGDSLRMVLLMSGLRGMPVTNSRKPTRLDDVRESVIDAELRLNRIE